MYIKDSIASFNKYGAIKTEYKGVKFDSKKEANFAAELDMMRKATNDADKVVKVIYQPKFKLQDGFTDNTGTKHRAIHYISDFKVTYANKYEEIIDVKGKLTEIYKLKKKLFLFKYPDLNFREV